VIGKNKPGKDGYIRTTRKGVKLGDHQWAFLDAHGWLPEMVCHHCDNPPCSEPAHLFAGNAQANSDDCLAKRRKARGERQGFAKLTETDVLKIRELYGESLGRRRVGTGGYRHADLAQVFGVCEGTVAAITQRRTWTHIP
jgi:hypothetical protein